jgi:hypothetical protein
VSNGVEMTIYRNLKVEEKRRMIYKQIEIMESLTLGKERTKGENKEK